MNKPFFNGKRLAGNSVDLSEANVLPVTQVRIAMPKVAPPRQTAPTPNTVDERK